MEKMSSGFPSDVLQLLCLSAVFYLAELSPKTTTAAAAASVCRQPTCCFQEPPWITELRQSSCTTSKGKPEDIFSIKKWPNFSKIAVLYKVLSCIRFLLWSSMPQSSYLLLLSVLMTRTVAWWQFELHYLNNTVFAAGFGSLQLFFFVP